MRLADIAELASEVEERYPRNAAVSISRECMLTRAIR